MIVHLLSFTQFYKNDKDFTFSSVLGTGIFENYNFYKILTNTGG